MTDTSSFAAGEAGDDGLTAPIETIGARYAIKVAQPGRGVHEPQTEPYLMPSVHGRNGSLEKVDPAITLTPLGGMMPGPNAIAPAVPAGHVGAFPYSEGEFGAGVADGWPEGSPVPMR